VGGAAGAEDADLGQGEHPAVQHCAIAVLLVGEGVVAGAPLVARIAWLPAFPHAAEERLESPLQSMQHFLHDLAVHRAVLQARLFQVGQLCALLGVRERDAATFPEAVLRSSSATL
jgi:hypothetical protein